MNEFFAALTSEIFEYVNSKGVLLYDFGFRRDLVRDKTTMYVRVHRGDHELAWLLERGITDYAIESGDMDVMIGSLVGDFKSAFDDGFKEEWVLYAESGG